MRRLQLDLILVFKIVKGFGKVETDKFFQFMEDFRTRFHNIQIYKETRRLNIKKYTVSQIVNTGWNSLLSEAVTGNTVHGIMEAIDALFQQNSGLYVRQKRLPAQL